jgi:hypothetical protein
MLLTSLPFDYAVLVDSSDRLRTPPRHISDARVRRPSRRKG